MLEVKRILCPVDFSEYSVRAYRHALSLAEHYQSKLVALHIAEVWRHPSASFAATASLYEEYCQSLLGNVNPAAGTNPEDVNPAAGGDAAGGICNRLPNDEQKDECFDKLAIAGARTRDP